MPSTWSARIRDLQKVGMTFQEIGEAIDLSGSAVGDLANGRSRSPRGDSAIRLVDLHQRRCGRRSRAGAGAHR